MFNCNTLLCSFCFILITGCKARQFAFRPETIVSEKLKSEIGKLAGNALPDKVTETYLYKAIIEEKLVEENRVSEYKLVNRYSAKKRIDIETAGYFHEIYLYQFRTENEQQYGLLLTASFTPDRKCIGVGPAYIGYVDAGKGDSVFITERELKIHKQGDSITGFSKGKPVQLLFFANKAMMGASAKTIHFYQVIQKSKNKIAGIGKELVYDVEAVFNDKQALVFELIR